MQFEMIGFELRRTIDETLKTLMLRAQQKGLALRCEIQDNVPDRLLGDPGRLRQILLNLVGNAVKFTEQGEVVVSVLSRQLAAHKAGLSFAVRDTGIGIPAEKCAHIFEAFTQADTSTTRHFGGTGLGLTISNRLVELMGGALAVDSTVGVGSTFSFSLELDIDTYATAPDREQPAFADGLTDGQGALQVLLVEDNAINQRLATRLLEKWGHRVTLAVNGLEALMQIEHRSFDVVLMDMQMPVMGGLEATRRIRERELGRELPRLRIIAMTANAMASDRDACLEAGMDDYLAKPIKADALAEKLASLSGHATPTAFQDSAFDYSLALAGMDVEIVEIIAPAFLECYRQELDDLSLALVAADANSAHRLSHALKGTLAAFGAGPAQQLAADIEMFCKMKQVDDAAKLFDALEAQVDLLITVLRGKVDQLC